MRQQHYRFAHQVFMNAVLRDAAGFWAAAPTRGNFILQEAWAAAGDGLGVQDRVDGSGLTISPIAAPFGAEALLVTLPPPQANAECYFIAVVRMGGQPARYFVAEKGTSDGSNLPCATWAEWRMAMGGVMRIRGQDLPTIQPEALVAAAVEECRGASVGPGPADFQGPSGFQGSGGFQQGGIFQGPSIFAGQPPKKKGRTGLFVGMGCLILFLFVVSFGGFLFYQEEGRGLHVPDTEVTSVPVEPGKPFVIQFQWNGTGWVFNNIWLVVDDGTKSGGRFQVGGTIECTDSNGKDDVKAELPGRNAYNVESKEGNAFSGWLYLKDEYEHSSSRTIECKGTLEPTVGAWTKARVVVTQRQRPSDWIAF